MPVPDIVWERADLDRCEKMVPEQLVFMTKGYVADGQYRHVFNPAADKIGEPDMTPHELRHTCASLAHIRPGPMFWPYEASRARKGGDDAPPVRAPV